MPNVSKPLVIFVHGFGSSSASWDDLVMLLEEDRETSDAFDFERFEYERQTKFVELDPNKRIPYIEEIGEQLGARLDSPDIDDKEITLVGHSMGGLVIQSYLADMVQDGNGMGLNNIRQVILFATPNFGSPAYGRLRRLLFRSNPQEKALRVYDHSRARFRVVVRDRVVGAKAATNHEWPIPIHAFYGEQDNIVPPVSARGDFYNVTALPGDHFAVIRPDAPDDIRYTEFVEALSLPAGHKNVFEVKRYDTEIKVWPVEEMDYEVEHGETKREVHTDNKATITRTVEFSPKNHNKSLFEIRYTSAKRGYLAEETGGGRNEASLEEKERHSHHGTEAMFKFTPAAQAPFRQTLTILKGFDAGNRDVHFHLGRHSYYTEIHYTLDLSEYVAAGYHLSTGPNFFLHLDDPQDHAQCQKRGLGEPLESESAEGGVFKWRIENIRQGVTTIVWDLEK